jgi:hypothetical protein
MARLCLGSETNLCDTLAKHFAPINAHKAILEVDFAGELGWAVFRHALDDKPSVWPNLEDDADACRLWKFCCLPTRQNWGDKDEHTLSPWSAIGDHNIAAEFQRYRPAITRAADIIHTSNLQYERQARIVDLRSNFTQNFACN